MVNPSFTGSLDVLVNLGSTALTASGLADAAPADLTAVALPYYEPLFTGNQDDLSSTVLEGRSATWHIDPVTHAITLRDTVAGARVVDLGDRGDAASERRHVVERPVSRVKMRVVAEFQQTAAARVDVAPLVSLAAAGYSGEVQSLSYAVPQPSATGGNLDFGWSSGSPKVEMKQTLGLKRPSGRTFKVTYREDVMSWSYHQSSSGATLADSVWTQGPEEVVEHEEYYQPVVAHITYLNWIKSCTFTQTGGYTPPSYSTQPKDGYSGTLQGVGSPGGDQPNPTFKDVYISDPPAGGGLGGSGPVNPAQPAN